MNAGKLMTGLVLLTIGILGFLDAIDVLDTNNLWRYWPVILIVIGAANELEALRARKSDGSFILIAVGVWLLAGTQRLFGLSFGHAMPLGIVVVGLAVLLHAIVDRPQTITRKENVHDQQ
jgi:hypothetical protein